MLMPKYQCPKCQATFDKQVKFCPECGEKMEWEKEEEPKKQKAPAKKDRYQYYVERDVADINCYRRETDLWKLYGWKLTNTVYKNTVVTQTPPHVITSPIHAWSDGDGVITVTGGDVTIVGGERVETKYYDLYFQRDTEDPLYPTWIKASNITDDYNLMCSQVRPDKSGVWFWGFVLMFIGGFINIIGAGSYPALSPQYGLVASIIIGVICYFGGLALLCLGLHIVTKKFYYNRTNWRFRRYFIKYLDDGEDDDATQFTSKIDEYVRRCAICSYGKGSLILPGNQLHRYCNDPFTKLNDMENNYSEMLATIHGLYIDEKISMERARMSFIWRLIMGFIMFFHFPIAVYVSLNDPEIGPKLTSSGELGTWMAFILIALAWTMPFFIPAFYYIKKYKRAKESVKRYETESSLELAREIEKSKE